MCGSTEHQKKDCPKVKSECASPESSATTTHLLEKSLVEPIIPDYLVKVRLNSSETNAIIERLHNSILF